MKEIEVWKDIPRYEGIYQASSYGRIRTKPGKTTYTEKHGIRRWKTRILKGRGNNPITGKRVYLWKNGKGKGWLVARLIGITFLGEPNKKMTINHKDGNRFNNKVENLEWLSLADNIRHAFDTGLMEANCKKVVLKTSKGNSKKFRSYAEASRYLGRNNGYVCQSIINNKNPITNINGEVYYIVQT